MALSSEEKFEIQKKSHRQLMWVALLSITMFFGGLISAYIVQRSDGTWVKIFLPKAFFISTLVILASSATFVWAIKSYKNGKSGSNPILITLVLGLAFVFFQYQGWKELNEKGQYLGGLNKVAYLLQNNQSTYGEDYVVMQNGKPLQYVNGNFYNIKDKGLQQPINLVNVEASNHAGSYLYILTGLHVLHLFGGLISLIVLYINSLMGKYSKNNYIGVQVSAIYWHFLDFLWLSLLGLLYFVG